MRRFCPCALLAVILAVRGIAGEPIRASGVLTPLMDIEVGSELLGTIVWMADEGSIIAKGEPLVKLRDAIEVLTVQLRAAQMDTARHAVDRYKLDYEDGKHLHTQKIISDEDMRAREFNYVRAKDQLEESIANHKLAIEDVQRRTVRAPLNCVVTRQLKKIGETLVLSAGLENLLRVEVIDTLYFVAYPDAKYAGEIKAGQKAEIGIPLRNHQKLVGDVAVVDPMVDANSGSFRVKILIQNQDHKIIPGVHGIVTLQTGD